MASSGIPEINVGLIGHVDHGKTTLTEAFSGVWTDKHSEELKRGISIRLGYADATFYRCRKCPVPDGYTTKKKCPNCGAKTEVLRTVSFVDTPGHETLMAVMLSGAAIMDGALLLVAANEHCPQPQTREHLMAMEASGIENIIVVQNKVDIVEEERAVENQQEIRDFLEGTFAEGSPIVPISALHEVNIDALIALMEAHFPSPKGQEEDDPRMYIARSFDVNPPGTVIAELTGGILGGSIAQGYFQAGDEVEISPGFRDENGNYHPLRTVITSIRKGNKARDKAGPGGLVGLGTKLDPALTKSDSLTGRVMGRPDTLPPMRHKLSLEINLAESVVGTGEDIIVEPLRTREPLMLTVGTAATVGVVTGATKKRTEMMLKIPVCADVGQRVAISRKFGNRWRLIGHGLVKD